MSQNTYRFDVGQAVPLDEAEMSLHLAMIALEGLFSPAAVRLDARYHVNTSLRVIVVDGSTEIGETLVRVFTTLLAREFGDDRFAVRRLPAKGLVADASEAPAETAVAQ